MFDMILSPLLTRKKYRFIVRWSWVILAAILLLALVLKLVFFMGFSLGDDPAYARGSYLLKGLKSYNLLNTNHIRFSIHLVNALFFKLFGVSDFSFVLSTLLCSMAIILFVFLLTRELFNPVAGLIAAFIMAISPFDLVFSTTMTIDFHATFGALVAFYCFILGVRRKERWWLFFIISALMAVYLYYVKIPALFVYVVIGMTAILYRRLWRRLIIYGGMLFVLATVVLVIESVVFGSFRAHYDAVLAPFANMISDLNLLTLFPRWMFLVDGNGHLLFGLLFYLLVPALGWLVWKRNRRVLPLVFWVVGWFLFMNFSALKMFPYTPSPRFFCNTYILVPAATILIAIVFYKQLWLRFSLFGLLPVLLLFGVFPMVQTTRQVELYRDSMKDMKAAVEFFDTVHDKAPVYSDSQFVDYFHYYNGFVSRQAASYYMNGKPVWEFPFEERFPQLFNIKRGFVVVGGSRYWHIHYSSYLYKTTWQPPKEWMLLKTINISKPGTPWKNEPLKIYYIKP